MPLGKWSRYGRKFKRLREVRGWSQREAADRFHISPQHLCDIEQGNRLPSWDLIKRMAKVLSADVELLDRRGTVADRRKGEFGP